MAITQQASGSQTAVINTEHTLCGSGDTVDLPVGSVYALNVDLVNMAAGDQVELRIYAKCRTVDVYRVYTLVLMTGVQGQPVVQTVPVMNGTGVRFTLKQIAGTGRAYPWAAIRAQ